MDEKTSIALLKERLNKDLTDLDAAVSLGNLYYDKGDIAQSIIFYRLALDINPSLSGVRTDMGTMYWRNDNLSLAEQAFREVIKQDPSFGHAYVNLGLLLQHTKGDVEQARSIWQDLVNANPSHPVAGKARELLQETAATVN